MTAFELRWATQQRVRRLSIKAHASRWDPTRIIGDGAAIKPPRFLPRRTYATLISQFLHGERATVHACRQLMAATDDAVMHEFLQTQIDDETRHARAYEHYVNHLGGVEPLDPGLAELLERVLGADGPPEIWLLGFQVLLEGEALRTLADFQGSLPCPVFAALNACIAQDEARHVAFGKLVAKDSLTRLTPGQRRDLYLTLQDLWRDAGAAVLGRVRLPDLFTRRLRRHWLAEGWDRHHRAFVEVGLCAAPGPAGQIDQAATA